MKTLTCRIVDAYQPAGWNHPNFDYEVYDGDEVVASGTSTSPDWVKHDAGGYHTKREFDVRYPEGWTVTFNF